MIDVRHILSKVSREWTRSSHAMLRIVQQNTSNFPFHWTIRGRIERSLAPSFARAWSFQSFPLHFIRMWPSAVDAVITVAGFVGGAVPSASPRACWWCCNNCTILVTWEYWNCAEKNFRGCWGACGVNHYVIDGTVGPLCICWTGRYSGWHSSIQEETQTLNHRRYKDYLWN